MTEVPDKIYAYFGDWKGTWFTKPILKEQKPVEYIRADLSEQELDIQKKLVAGYIHENKKLRYKIMEVKRKMEKKKD